MSDETAVMVVGEERAATLFRTDDPVEIVERASRVADALRGVIDRQKLFATVGGRKHVLVEGWTLCGTLLGVFPVLSWSRRLEDGSGYEARVEAHTLDGRVVGAAEALCSRSERTWATREDFALKSMAQTRATSKAMRQPLGFIVSLAGYEATPLEEMSPKEAAQPQPRQQVRPQPSPPLEGEVVRPEVLPEHQALLDALTAVYGGLTATKVDWLTERGVAIDRRGMRATITALEPAWAIELADALTSPDPEEDVLEEEGQPV